MPRILSIRLEGHLSFVNIGRLLLSTPLQRPLITYKSSYSRYNREYIIISSGAYHHLLTALTTVDILL